MHMLMFSLLLISAATGFSIEILPGCQYEVDRFNEMQADNIRYSMNNNTIIVSSGLDSRVLLSEAYRIIGFQLSMDESKILYTYGESDFSFACIYDLNSGVKNNLLEINNNGGDRVEFTIIRDVIWYNNDIIYIVYDEKTGINICKKFVISSRDITDVFSGFNLELLDCFDDSLLYYQIKNNRKEMFVYNIIENTGRSILINKNEQLVNGRIINSECYFFITSIKSELSSLLLFYKEDDLLMQQALGYVISVSEYNRSDGVLILLMQKTSDPQSRYYQYFRIIH